MGKSSVAGIVDVNGGLRVVVTKRWRMMFHVNEGERLFVVPKLKVTEPVVWEDQPMLINIVEKYVQQQLSKKP